MVDSEAAGTGKANMDSAEGDADSEAAGTGKANMDSAERDVDSEAASAAEASSDSLNADRTEAEAGREEAENAGTSASAFQKNLFLWMVLGQLFVAGWFATEGFFQSLLSAVSLGSAILNTFAVGGPLLLVVGGGVGVLAGLWAVTWWPAVKRFFLESAETIRVRHTAAVVLSMVGLLLLFVSTLLLGMTLFRVINTLVFALTVLVFVQGAVALALVGVAPALFLLMCRFLRWLQSFGRAGYWLVQPGVVLLMVGLLAPLGWFAIPAASREVLPVERVAAPIVGLLFALLVLKRARAWGELPLVRKGGYAGSVALGLGLSFYGAFNASPEAVALIRQTKSAPIIWLKVAERVFDFDRDGYLSVFGGGDCAPLDPGRSPGVAEIPNNGIDEDCSGSDLQMVQAEVVTGRRDYIPPPGLDPKPNILLFTADGLTYSHTALGGYAQEISPGLTQFAAQSTNFTSAFASSSATDVSFPALLTGRHPIELPFKIGHPKPRPFVFERPVPTFVGALHKSGYRTVFIAPSHFFERWGSILEDFDEVMIAPELRTEKRKGADASHSANLVADEAIRRIRSAEPHQPLFLWTHYYDMHWPNGTPRGETPLGNGTSEDHYNAEVLFADKHWSRVLDEVSAAWPREKRLVIFTADHGEAYDELHKENARHNAHLHTAETHVPLIVQAPWQSGNTVNGLVSHLDIFPTLANLLRHEQPAELRGESLLPALAVGKEPEKNVLYDFYLLPNTQLFQSSVRTADYHMLQWRGFGTQQVFRWREDPWEKVDVIANELKTAGWLNYLGNKAVMEYSQARGR